MIAYRTKRVLRKRTKLERIIKEHIWGTVRFTLSNGYNIEALFNTKEEADKVVAREAQKIIHNYTVVFTVPVHAQIDNITGDSCESYKYTRGTAYYATLQGSGQDRILILWSSRKKAEEIITAASIKDHIYVGGPVILR